MRFYNDSKATNTSAAATALSAFDGNIILLAGGFDKGICYDELRVFDKKVKRCIAYGAIKEQFLSVFTNVDIVNDMKEAFERAVEIASTGDVILLAPGTSSYDQFPNYEVRGRVFKEYVSNYLLKHHTM